MPSEDVNWVSAPGLRRAAIHLDEFSGNADRVISNMFTRIGNKMSDPATYGDDKGGREFGGKFIKDSGDWASGVKEVGKNFRAASTGVRAMAKAAEQTDKTTTDTVEGFHKYVTGSSAAPGSGGSGGGINNPNLPSLPPPSTGGGNNSGGGTGGGRPGRR